MTFINWTSADLQIIAVCIRRNENLRKSVSPFPFTNILSAYVCIKEALEPGYFTFTHVRLFGKNKMFEGKLGTSVMIGE